MIWIHLMPPTWMQRDSDLSHHPSCDPENSRIWTFCMLSSSHFKICLERMGNFGQGLHLWWKFGFFCVVLQDAIYFFCDWKKKKQDATYHACMCMIPEQILPYHMLCLCSHYQKYWYRMRPIRSGFLWIAFKILSTKVHIVLLILIIGGRVICISSLWRTAADNTLNYQQRFRILIVADNLVIRSGSKPRPAADNGVYNQQRFIMWTNSD
jgi:hypothetical protein